MFIGAQQGEHVLVWPNLAGVEEELEIAVQETGAVRCFQGAPQCSLQKSSAVATRGTHIVAESGDGHPPTQVIWSMVDHRHSGRQHCILVDQGVPFDRLAVCDELVATLDGLTNVLENFQDAVRTNSGEANRKVGQHYVRYAYQSWSLDPIEFWPESCRAIPGANMG
ncbi:hypothetical protein D9M73_174020 [compost metagenome]